LSAEADWFRRRAERLSPLVAAVALNATQPADAARLAPWCRDGHTLALVGSSGVGKTTLQNALTGAAEATAAIREDDARGRHTTTARALRPTCFGGWLIDTPGMRELGLAQAAAAIDEVFADVTDFADRCRFADCRHEGEPGCAVAAAVDAGQVDPARLARWLKLRREDRHASETLAERRERDRSLGRLHRGGRMQAAMKRRRWDDD
jgi:ribosome biogenesis GTPase / thiamine phosphate phosphatase